MKIISRYEHATVKHRRDIDYTDKDLEKDPWKNYSRIASSKKS